MPYMNQLPRLIGCCLLFAFGLSHLLASVSSNAPMLGLSNTVFPMVRNGTVFTFAGVFQIVLAIQVFRYRRTARSDLLLVVAGGLLIWYRIARWFLGDTQACGCAGLLREYLQLTAQQERTYATLGVMSLLLCALPGFLVHFINNRKCQSIGRAAVNSLTAFGVILGYFLAAEPLSADQNVKFTGKIVEERLNANDEPYTNLTQNYSWVVEMTSAGTWSLVSTNLATGWWQSVVFDGTDSYIVLPSASDDRIENSTVVKIDPTLNLAFVSRGPLPLLVTDDVGQVCTLWVCFCSSQAKRILRPNDSNPNWPLLGWRPRKRLDAWGFRWFVVGRTNSVGSSLEFPATIEMVRDRDLDAKDFNAALNIPEYEYPMIASDLADAELDWAILKSYDQGSLGAKYEAKEWSSYQGLSVPKTAELSYWRSGKKPAKYHRITVFVDLVQELQPTPHSAPPFKVKTRVDDYRFQEKGEDKHFTSATYLAREAESWRKGDDQGLKEQQTAWRQRGPKNFTGAFRPINIILLLGLIPAIFVAFRTWSLLENK